MKFTLKQLITLINSGNLKNDIIKLFKQNFINSLKTQKYNNFSILNLKKEGIYKTYYVLSKEICETSYNKQNITKFKDLNEMAEMIYNDIFYNSYDLDGEGNLNEIITNLELSALEPYLNLPINKIETPIDNIPKNTLVEVYGGKRELQSENNISQKYNSIEELITKPEKPQEILVSVLLAKITYLDLRPRYSIVSNRVSKTGFGYLSYKNTSDEQIYNDVQIYKTIPYFQNIEERIAPEAGDFFKLKLKQRFGKTDFILDEDSKQHQVILFRWNDDPTKITDIQTVLIDQFIVNDFFSKIGKRDNIKSDTSKTSVKTESDTSKTSVETESDTEIINLGRINYYLSYDMKSEKFYLSLRGTNFGNRDDDVGEYLSSGMSNIILDLQIAIDKIRQIYHQETSTDLTKLLHSLRDYLKYVIYNLLNDTKCLITNKPFSEYGDYNTIIDIVIHIMYNSTFTEILDKFIEQIIAIPNDIGFTDFNQILLHFVKELLNSMFYYEYIKKLLPMSDEKIKEKILLISNLLHLCITKNYLDITKKYSSIVVSQAKHIIRCFGFDPDQLIICGHSLGGGLTQHLCKLYNSKGYTFNPIGGRILADDITLNFNSPFIINIPALKDTKVKEISLFTFEWLKTRVSEIFYYSFSSIVSAFELTFPRVVFSRIELPLPLHIYNIVVSQDIIHKVLLSHDYNQHIGELYICSIEKYLDFYTESYLFDNEYLQISNITMFHGIDGLLILLNKIINKKRQKIRHVNNSIIDFSRVIASNNTEYCSYRDNFIYFPDNIKIMEAVEDDAFEKKYYKKYLKYKNKYLALKK